MVGVQAMEESSEGPTAGREIDVEKTPEEAPHLISLS